MCRSPKWYSAMRSGPKNKVSRSVWPPRSVAREVDEPVQPLWCHVEDHQVVLAGVLGGDREVAAVRRPGAGRVDESQALEIGAEGALDQAALDLPGLPVREVKVHEERVALGQIGDVLAVRRQGGGEVQGASGAPLGQQRLGEAPGGL